MSLSNPTNPPYDLSTPESLPCGCRLGTTVIDNERTLVYQPCSETCKYYLYTLRESRKRGNSIERRTV